MGTINRERSGAVECGSGRPHRKGIVTLPECDVKAQSVSQIGLDLCFKDGHEGRRREGASLEGQTDRRVGVPSAANELDDSGQIRADQTGCSFQDGLSNNQGHLSVLWLPAEMSQGPSCLGIGHELPHRLQVQLGKREDIPTAPKGKELPFRSLDHDQTEDLPQIVSETIFK